MGDFIVIIETYNMSYINTMEYILF
jgi:hypothetical protein